MDSLPVNFPTVLYGIILPTAVLLALAAVSLIERRNGTPFRKMALPVILGGTCAAVMLIDVIQRMNGYTGILH